MGVCRKLIVVREAPPGSYSFAMARGYEVGLDLRPASHEHRPSPVPTIRQAYRISSVWDVTCIFMPENLT